MGKEGEEMKKIPMQDVRLIDVLLMIDKDLFPLRAQNGEIDDRNQSVYKVILCAMCEEETHVQFEITSVFLVPWYDCRVMAIEPEDSSTIQIWLYIDEFIRCRHPDYIDWREEECKKN